MGSGALENIQKILTYDNSTLDIILNYILLFISFPLICILNYWFIRSNLYSSPVQRSRDISLIKYCLFPGFYVTSLFIFQIGICLLADCVGISIVWSSNVGVILIFLKYFWTNRQDSDSYRAAHETHSFSFDNNLCCTSSTGVVLVACVAVWGYYAVVEEALTTVAHICALLLGAMIGHVYVRYCDSVGQSDYSACDEAQDEYVQQRK
mmetsp:Transcript_19814/g.33332  ORF Transcript_19814/g.33332 Transcript_19814/m.33332 type:complete len:208 (+) Transcript_19814:111-734(+)